MLGPVHICMCVFLWACMLSFICFDLLILKLFHNIYLILSSFLIFSDFKKNVLKLEHKIDRYLSEICFYFIDFTEAVQNLLSFTDFVLLSSSIVQKTKGKMYTFYSHAYVQIIFFFSLKNCKQKHIKYACSNVHNLLSIFSLQMMLELSTFSYVFSFSNSIGLLCVFCLRCNCSY